MNDRDTTRPTDDVPTVEEYQRPLPDQVSAIRHDLAGVRQQVIMIHGVYDKLVRRVEHVEERQTLMDAQIVGLSISPDALALVINDVLDMRTEAARAERRKDLADAFGRTKTVALYVTAVGQAILMLAALYYFVAGSPL